MNSPQSATTPTIAEIDAAKEWLANLRSVVRPCILETVRHALGVAYAQAQQKEIDDKFEDFQKAKRALQDASGIDVT